MTAQIPTANTALTTIGSSAGNVASSGVNSVYNNDNVSTVATEHNRLAQTAVPAFVLGTLSPGSLDIPFRSANYAFTYNDLTKSDGTSKPWQVDVATFAAVKTITKSFGFAYWKSLYVELYKPATAPFYQVTALGGFTWHRETTPSDAVISALPTASSYNFPSGVAVRIECPFGGLISPLLSSKPLVGNRASFCMVPRAANVHPYIPITAYKDGKAVETLAMQPVLSKTDKILYIRLHGVMCVSQPLPGLTGAI